MSFRRSGLLLAFVLLAAGCSGVSASQESGDDVLSAGIGVHGAWSVQVIDPDGTVVREAAFDNGFIGHDVLMDVFTSTRTVGGWGIALNGNTNLCNETSTLCSTYEADLGFPPSDARFDTLTVERVGSGGTSALVLSGSIVAGSQATDIDIVRATMVTCASTATAEACSSGGALGSASFFTFKRVDTMDWDPTNETTSDGPIPVAPGQTVQVTVEITLGTLE